ncbi:uncharacterized protein BDV17DRAFT_186659 [Aspergillus undulatus]|uniref:uncharacterized protein n=1 Tax=Aspergillus undulatus TaxID=1810928 RepID=UPI003CCE0E35
MPKIKNPFKKSEGGSGLTGITVAAAGADTGLQNPMGGVQGAQKAYHLHKHGKAQKAGMIQGLLNEDKANKKKKEMGSGQVAGSSMVWGENGITEANGYKRDKAGRISFVGKGKK